MATSKVYYCHICEDDGIYIEPYNRKEYFKHIKTNDHKEKAKIAKCKVHINVKHGVIEKSGKTKLAKKSKNVQKGNAYIETLEFFHNQITSKQL